MATKLNTPRSTTNGRRTPDGKRVTFDRGQAKSGGKGLPMKTADVQKE